MFWYRLKCFSPHFERCLSNLLFSFLSNWWWHFTLSSVTLYDLLKFMMQITQSVANKCTNYGELATKQTCVCTILAHRWWPFLIASSSAVCPMQFVICNAPRDQPWSKEIKKVFWTYVRPQIQTFDGKERVIILTIASKKNISHYMKAFWSLKTVQAVLMTAA